MSEAARPSGHALRRETCAHAGTAEHPTYLTIPYWRLERTGSGRVIMESQCLEVGG